MSKRGVVIGIVAGVAAITLLLALIDPTGPYGMFLPKCPMKWLTGYDCPGCGSTRAMHALLTGHPTDALRHNLFLPLAVLVIICSTLAEWMPKRFAGMRKIIFSPAAGYGFATLCVGWWIGRNLLNI